MVKNGCAHDLKEPIPRTLAEGFRHLGYFL